MSLLKIIYIIAPVVFVTLTATAQQKGQISGTLTDTSGRKSIVFASVTVFNAADTSIVTYRLSNEQGRFNVPGLPPGKALRVVISATGYAAYRQEFMVTNDSTQIDFGIIRMKPSFQELEEVLVIAERPPVVVRRDTIEFYASAFKTLPTALLEDLLKKFPGVEVDRDGNITVNGRRVSKMLVDGKEFFGSDPKVASRNLPANLIDKVQVADDNEELLRNPDLSRGQVSQVINIKLKKNIKQGWFGKAYAGAGTRDRYEGGGIVNLFKDTLQVSVLGYTNNLSRSGFSIQDVMSIGGFSRSRVSNVKIDEDGAYSLNDISFGASGQGIQRSAGAGINTNTVVNKKTTVNLQYFYGNNISEVGQTVHTVQSLGDTALTTHTTSNGETHENWHRFTGVLRNKPNAFTTWEYKPLFLLSNLSGMNHNETRSSSNFDPLLNESLNDQRKDRNGFSMIHTLTYTRSFARKGRSLYASLIADINNDHGRQYNDATSTFYKTGNTAVLNQYRNQLQENRNGQLYVNYTEPLSKNWSWRSTESVELFDLNDDVDTYDYDPVKRAYTVLNPLFTNGVNRSGFRSTSYTGVTWRHKAFSITPGTHLRGLHINNRFSKDQPVDQRFLYLLPAMNITWNKWGLNYSVNVAEPSLSNLQPAINNTNPLYIYLGNQALQPTLSHDINLTTYSYDIKRSLNYNVYMLGSMVRHAIIQQRTIDKDGVQTIQPVNTNGVWRFYGSASVNKQYKFDQNTKVSVNLLFAGQYNQAVLLINDSRSTMQNLSVSPALSWSVNWKDIIDLNQRYKPTWAKNIYQHDLYPMLNYWRHSASTELVVRRPKHMVWETSVDLNYNPQVAAGVQKSVFRWNAATNLLFLKEDKGQLKLSVYDLLNQNVSVSRSIQENFIRDTETLILRRYLLLTFTYNIRNIGGKTGGNQRLLIF